MEDRQRQVQVGAGLQESRLNTDLIQFLQKFGSPILTIVLVVVLGYVGYTKYRQWQDEKRDQAFDAYLAARVGVGPDGVLTGSPDNLLRVADEKKGQGAVWELATLDAADIGLGAARRGLKPGTDSANPKPEDTMTEAEKTEQIKKADQGYRAVLDATKGSSDHLAIALRARWGLVATATSLGEFDRTKSTLEEIDALAKQQGLAFQSALVKKRLDALPKLKTLPVLLAEADLPESARPPKPAGAMVPQGAPLKIEGIDRPIVLPSPPPSQAPAPTPAPETPAPSEPAKPQE